MTLSVVWERNAGNMRELVFASDSCLSFGQRWDCCPKVFALPRSDALISFAGDANYRVPVAAPTRQHHRVLRPSRDRRLDLTHVKGHALRVFDQMLSLIHALPIHVPELEQPTTLFMLGVTSWRDAGFRAWLIDYSPTDSRFIARKLIWPSADATRRWSVHFDGTAAAVEEANARLGRLLAERGIGREDGLDMEPFEVLRDVIRDQVDDTVAGAPQLAKVYRHLNTQFFAVPWNGELTIAGRPVLAYERAQVPMIDPDDPARPPSYESGAPVPGEEGRFAGEGDDDEAPA